MKYFKMFLKKLLRYVLKPLSFLPALMMMFVIFNFSAQDGTASSSVSSTVSVRFVQVCDRALDRGWSDAQIAHYAERIEHYVRKLAHVTEYFLLAVAVSFPLYVYRLRGWRLVLAAGLFCVSSPAWTNGISPLCRAVLPPQGMWLSTASVSLPGLN